VRATPSVAYRKLATRLGLICTVANLAGAVFVFLYLVVIAPRQGGADGWVANMITFAAFGIVAFTVEGCWSEYRWRRVLAWFGEQRPPTDTEQAATLRLPMHEAGWSFLAWLAASVFFPLVALALGDSSDQAIRVALTIFDGGLVTCAIVFLSFERALRPAFAAALAHEPPERATTIGVRPRLLLTWALGSGVPLAGLLLLPCATSGGTSIEDIGGAVVALSIVGLVAGSLTTFMSARSVADPLRAVQHALDRVGKGDLDVSVRVVDGGEIGLLQSGVNQMVAGLRERQRLADLFGRHVGPEVARLALEQGTGLASEQRDATAMFVDLVGSSARWGVEKPSPAFFERVVREAGCEPGEVAYVGDRVDNDVVPAAAAGLVAVHVRRGPWGYLQPGAEQAALRVDSLSELPEALDRV